MGLTTSYGPCHRASSLLVDVGSNTSTWSPGSNLRVLAFRSYHFFGCLEPSPYFVQQNLSFAVAILLFASHEQLD